MMAKSRAHQIVGDYGNRRDSDFYITPPGATEALFKREHFEGIVWEPASGNGAMSKIIEKYNECVSSDIRTSDDVYGIKGIDFLSDNYELDFQCHNIITNPPFRYGLGFVNRAKQLVDRKIALLLKLPFLEGITRYDMWHDKEFPLKKVWVFSRRVTIRGPNSSGGGGMIAFAWYIWDFHYKGDPTIGWIDERVEPL